MTFRIAFIYFYFLKTAGISKSWSDSNEFFLRESLRYRLLLLELLFPVMHLLIRNMTSVKPIWAVKKLPIIK